MPVKKAWTLRQKITGVLLRQARQDAGKSLKQSGQALGLSSSAVAAMEHGRRPVSLPELEILAYYFGVPLEQLLNGHGTAPAKPVEELPTSELLALRQRIVGALLRRARLERELSWADLAKSAGLRPNRLSQYELGEMPIPLPHLEALAEALRVPLDYFLDEGVGPIGSHRQQERECRQFTQLPPEVRAFVVDPNHLAYLRLAMFLSDMPADTLRNIAASLLDITL
jgi:transcriptional regulator with XRE-family HTH domain